MNLVSEPELTIDGRSSVHRQIHDQIRGCILAGSLETGEQLPSVRALAVALAVNPRSVMCAYRLLQREGLLSMKEGSGAFVRRPAGPPEPLESLCRDLLQRAAAEGYTPQQVFQTMSFLTERSSP
jgi:GntR family transcriptional regulator